jgi:prepilin-type N-terminal cleavage/methylation domain-containing protein
MRRLNTQSQTSCHNKRRNAFTLLEIMIVVSILAMISAMAAPQLMSLVQESSLFREADSVREWMAETRRYAIDTGIDYEFRYELNGASFVVLPTENELNVDDNGESTTTEEYRRVHKELSEGIQLKGPEDVDEAAESLDAEKFRGLDASELSGKSWSAPIIFSFDGTTQDFTLRIVNKDGLTAEVALRGLTGAVSTRAAEIYQEDD